jgi:hypothetical protein
MSVLLLFAGMLFAWDGFIKVSAEEKNNGIEVSWRAKSDHNVKYYEVYRIRANGTVADKRYSIQKIVDEAFYYFNDDNIFSKSSESGAYDFEYYVRAVMNDGTFVNSDKIQVSLTSLGVTQQTWGSIKAMFR